MQWGPQGQLQALDPREPGSSVVLLPLWCPFHASYFLRLDKAWASVTSRRLRWLPPQRWDSAQALLVVLAQLCFRARATALPLLPHTYPH